MSYRQYNNLDKNLIFKEYFNDEQSLRRLSGIPSGTYSFSRGEAIFTTDAKIAFSNPVYGIKSIRLIVDLDSTTEDILNLSTSHSIEVSAGTVTATGVSSPTIYIDGVAGSTITTSKAEIIITTATTFDADDIVAGYISAYLEGKISLIEFYNVTLSAESIKNLYNNSRYVVPSLNKAAQGDGTDLNVSDCVNSDYTTFSNGTPTGFNVISDGSSEHQAGTADEIFLVSGQKYVVNFDMEANSGTAPIVRFKNAFGGINYTTGQTAAAGHNAMIFIALASATCRLTFYNLSTTTDFEISNLSVQNLTVEPTQEILSVNAF